MSERVLVTKDFTDEIDELISLGNTDKDDDAVKGIVITSFDFKLYFVIRKHIDWETGTVGENGFGPTRHTLIKKMQERRIHGSTKQVLEVTEGVIRSSIARLEKAGFLVVKSINTKNDKRLIFELPKAIRDESVNFGNNRRTTETLQPEESIDLKGIDAMGTTDEQPTMNARYHIDRNIYKSKDLYIGDKKEKAQKKRKTVEKEPPEALVNFVVTDKHRAYAKEKGLCDPAQEVEDFKLHHLARPVNWKKISDWDLAFYTFLRNEKKWRKVSFTPKNDARSNPAAYKEFFPSSKPPLDARDKEIEELKAQARNFYRLWGDEELSVDERKKNKESYFECKKKLEALGVTL
jgi:hypothetical protein